MKPGSRVTTTAQYTQSKLNHFGLDTPIQTGTITTIDTVCSYQIANIQLDNGNMITLNVNFLELI